MRSRKAQKNSICSREKTSTQDSISKHMIKVKPIDIQKTKS